MKKRRNLIFLCLLILGVLLIAGCSPKPPVMVTFDSQGGSAVDSQMVDHHEKVTKPTAPTKEGYTFGGWYKESECTNDWNFYSDTVTSDVTLYAKWIPLYTLRETGPAGGLIFYVKEGGYSDGWMYLEVAPVSTEWWSIQWGSFGNDIGGTLTDIGAGQSNTTTIVTWLNSHSETGRAAQLCNELIVDDYNDWFLPSKDELNLMYENLEAYGIGVFVEGGYWSSTEFTAVHLAWAQFFGGGNQATNFKNGALHVRAVRAF